MHSVPHLEFPAAATATRAETREVLVGLGERAASTTRPRRRRSARSRALRVRPEQSAMEGFDVAAGRDPGRRRRARLPARAERGWSMFLLRISRLIVEQMDQFVRDALDAAADLVDAALREPAASGPRTAGRDRRTGASGSRPRRLALEIKSVLRSNSRRQGPKNALRAQGALEAERMVRIAGQRPRHGGPGEDLAVAAPSAASTSRSAPANLVIDLAFEAAETVADDVADLVDGAVDAAEGLERIIAAAVDAAVGGVTDAVAALGIDLPSEPALMTWRTRSRMPCPSTSCSICSTGRSPRVNGTTRRSLRRPTRSGGRRPAGRHDRRRRGGAAMRPAGAASRSARPCRLRETLSEATAHGPEVEVLVRVTGANAVLPVRARETPGSPSTARTSPIAPPTGPNVSVDSSTRSRSSRPGRGETCPNVLRGPSSTAAGRSCARRCRS